MGKTGDNNVTAFSTASECRDLLVTIRAKSAILPLEDPEPRILSPRIYTWYEQTAWYG